MMVLENLLSIDWNQLLSHLILMLVAFGLALPIGWDRERSRRGFGLRTFPIVAVVACGFMLVGLSVIDSTDGEARVMQGIITGIGFIGGGAILKNKDGVSGTASAASIWNSWSIGVSVAYSRFEVAIILALLNFITLHALRGRVKQEMTKGADDDVE